MKDKGRHRVAILGATGMVGQKAIALLQNHKFLDVTELAASEKNEGKRYGDVVNWKEPLVQLGNPTSDMVLKKATNITEPFVISCLPANVAKEVEQELCDRGHIVFSNASSNRMRDNVPLMVPEINSAHLELLKQQSSSGKIITNPNCATTFLTLALAPLLKLGKIKHVSVVTMQSVSGAGANGVSSMEILGNIIPFINQEEEKIEAEAKKILGSKEEALDIQILSHVNRVPVLYGHMLVVHVTFDEPTAVEDARDQYSKENQVHPSLYVLHEEQDRPQPRVDLAHDDLRVHIGRFKQGASNEIGMIVLGNNLVRGAAGATIANIAAYIDWEERGKL